MIIQIQSKNSFLLDILYKNPNTDMGLYLKKLKNGVIVGNAVSAHEYHCIFQDTKYSYLPEESNQIDFQSYCSPLLVLNMMSELFSHLYKNREDLANTELSWLGKTYREIDTKPCTIVLKTFFIDSNWYKFGTFLLSKYIDGIALHPKIGFNYELSIEGNTVREAMLKLSVVSLFSHFTNRYAVHQYIVDDFIRKYIDILTNLEGVPYFVFYLFIKRIIRSKEQFEKFKPALEDYFNGQTQFVFTDTHQSRKEFICRAINMSESILDFGCGELQYYKKLQKMGFREDYWAYDMIDYSKQVELLVEAEQCYNLRWISDRNSLVDFKGQVILSEVIEHNSVESARELLIWIRDHVRFTRLFITTPDREFNVHYDMTEDFRHDDHDFEWTHAEFRAVICEIFHTKVEFYGIGDCINGVYPTSAAIVHNEIEN